jgi:hypothetical protein
MAVTLVRQTGTDEGRVGRLCAEGAPLVKGHLVVILRYAGRCAERSTSRKKASWHRTKFTDNFPVVVGRKRRWEPDFRGHLFAGPRVPGLI